MTTPTGQGRVDEHPRAARQVDPRSAPPARPTPWLGADGGSNGGGDAEWFDNDPPTQPLPVIREPRQGAHSRPAQPVREAAPARQAPALRDVPVRDIARAQEPPPAARVAPARVAAPAVGTPQGPARVAAPAVGTLQGPTRVAAPAVGTLHEPVTTVNEVQAWSPPRPKGPRKIPVPIKVSFRWWVMAVAFAVISMTLSVVLAVIYAGRYGTTAAGGATVGGILFEVLLLGGAGFVVVRMRAGDDWARTLLAAGGGLMALIVAMNTAGEFSFGSTLVAGFTTGIATLRLFEAVSAAVAIWYMFQPGVGKYFDPRGRED